MPGRRTVSKRDQIIRDLGIDPIPEAWRMIYQQDKTYAQVGMRFGVDPSLVWRWLRIYRVEHPEVTNGRAIGAAS